MVPVNLEKTLKYCFNLFPEIMFFEYDLRKRTKILAKVLFSFSIFFHSSTQHDEVSGYTFYNEIAYPKKYIFKQKSVLSTKKPYSSVLKKQRFLFLRSFSQS